MSSPDNPQFEPPVTAEAQAPTPTLSAPDPFGTASIPPIPAPPPPIENPVWNGWDVLLIAGLTVVTMVVFQLAVLLAAHFIWYPQESLADLSKQPIVLIVSQILIYIPVAVLHGCAGRRKVSRAFLAGDPVELAAGGVEADGVGSGDVLRAEPAAKFVAHAARHAV